MLHKNRQAGRLEMNEVSREYIAIFEPDEDGWCASVPDLPGCPGDGTTFEEA